MFDFDRWCLWAEAQCLHASNEGLVVRFERGQPSAKRGATINFTTDSRLMQLAFWETGEADFYGMGLHAGDDVLVFVGRILEDQSFERTFFEYLGSMA